MVGLSYAKYWGSQKIDATDRDRTMVPLTEFSEDSLDVRRKRRLVEINLICVPFL